MWISSRISSTNRFLENKNGGDIHLRHFYNLSSESEIVMKRSSRTCLFWRCLFYMIGIILLAVGLTLNTKASLGVAPVITLPFVIASILPIDFATATFSVYFIFVCIQLALNRNRPKIKILLQFPFSFFFSLLLRLFSALLAINISGKAQGLLLLAASIVITAGGICLMVNMNYIANPADGLAHTIADSLNKNTGTGKNILDCSCVLFSCVLIIATGTSRSAIGVGTLISMIGVGRILALFNRLFQRKMLLLCGMVPEATPCK